MDSSTAATAGRGVLEGAFALLDALGVGGDAGLTRLSAASGLPKATAYRLLEQLTALGAVEKTGGRYRIGPRVFQLGRGWCPDPTLLGAAQGPMRRLTRATGATVGLGVLGRGQVITVGGVPGELAGRVSIEPGTIWPRSTAAGKALLAWSPRVAALVPAEAMPAALAARIREKGAVFDHEETLPGVCCVAVPLHGANPDVPAAVLCAMVGAGYPLSRLAAMLTATSAMIGATLR